MQKTCPKCGWPMQQWERVGVWRCAGCGEEIPFTTEERQQMDILRRAGYGAGSEPAKVEVERKPFYIVCGKCGNPYRVVVAEKERIKGECPWCKNPIDVVRYKNRLFEIVNEEWKEMEREPIWRVAG